MDRYILEDIQVARGGANVLDIPQLAIEEGKITAIMGPNGSGKTTLLLVLAGLLPADRGSLLCGGIDLARCPEAALMEHRRQNQLLLQEPYLFSRSVEWNVAYGPSLRGLKGDVLKRRAAWALDAVGLAELAGRPASELSGGEVQRVALARALAAGPEALLLDEPLANVDVASRSVIEDVLRRENRDRSATVVFATHHLEQAHRLANRVVVLRGGRMVEGALENTFHGKVERGPGGAVFRSGELAVTVPAGSPDAGVLSIPPDSVIISLSGELPTSARNALPGRITAVRERNGSVEVSVDAGREITARITNASYRHMGLTLGREVWLLFKAGSVKLY